MYIWRVIIGMSAHMSPLDRLINLPLLGRRWPDWLVCRHWTNWLVCHRWTDWLVCCHWTDWLVCHRWTNWLVCRRWAAVGPIDWFADVWTKLRRTDGWCCQWADRVIDGGPTSARQWHAIWDNGTVFRVVDLWVFPARVSRSRPSRALHKPIPHEKPCHLHFLAWWLKK